MEQLAIVARLKPGAEDEARKLIEEGPPFEIADSGLERHTIYLSAGEVVLVFEGREVEGVVDAMIEDPFRPALSDAFASWRPLVEERAEDRTTRLLVAAGRSRHADGRRRAAVIEAAGWRARAPILDARGR